MSNSTPKSYDVVSSFEGDPFVGHLSTPITTSTLTKTYLSLLPAYKVGLSPLLRGINIGFVHGYFLLGPFVKLGPLRDSQVANFVGFVSTISLIIILTTCLLIYGFVTFSDKNTKIVEINARQPAQISHQYKSQCSALDIPYYIFYSDKYDSNDNIDIDVNSFLNFLKNNKII